MTFKLMFIKKSNLISPISFILLLKIIIWFKLRDFFTDIYSIFTDILLCKYFIPGEKLTQVIDLKSNTCDHNIGSDIK